MQRTSRLKKVSKAEEALAAIAAAKKGERSRLDELEPNEDLEDDVELEAADHDAGEDQETDYEAPGKRKAAGAMAG